MIRRYIRHYISRLHELLDAKDAPHSVAGGTTIGIFFGFIPIFGLKTLAAMGVAMLTRCSLIAAVIGVSLHDVLLPIWPLILRYQFQVGYWVLSHPHHFAPPLTKSDFRFSEIFQWQTFLGVGLPLVVGGLVFAVPCCLIAYATTLVAMSIRAETRRRRARDRARELGQ